MIDSQSLRTATGRRPERGELGEDPVAELVAGTRKRERCVRVQAFEAAAARRAADSDRKLGPQTPLLSVRVAQAGLQIRFTPRALAPPLDAARGLYPRHRGNEVRAGQPEGGRERLAALVVRRLLRDRRATERAADSYAAESPRRTPQLSLDDGTVIHHRRG
jgi:hypothetical protein